MASSTYDTDILAWANEQARLLRASLFSQPRPGLVSATRQCSSRTRR